MRIWKILLGPLGLGIKMTPRGENSFGQGFV
jgi:hypothetical protein